MADVFVNPTPEELRRFTEAMPECRITEFGNVNVQTRVAVPQRRQHVRRRSRLEREDDDPRGRTTTLARRQDEYVATTT